MKSKRSCPLPPLDHLDPLDQERAAEMLDNRPHYEGHSLHPEVEGVNGDENDCSQCFD
jgi:hypothetical protein